VIPNLGAHFMRFLLLLAAGVFALPTRGAEPLPELDPAKPYTAAKSAPVAYDIDFRVVVTPPSGTKTLKVWVPVAQDDLGQKITEGDWSVFPADVKPTFHTEKVFGNRFAYFEFASPQGAQIIGHTFKATVWQLDWDLDAAKVQKVESWPAAFDQFRRAERNILIDDRIKKLAGDVTGK